MQGIRSRFQMCCESSHIAIMLEERWGGNKANFEQVVSLHCEFKHSVVISVQCCLSSSADALVFIVVGESCIRVYCIRLKGCTS